MQYWMLSLYIITDIFYGFYTLLKEVPEINQQNELDYSDSLLAIIII